MGASVCRRVVLLGGAASAASACTAESVPRSDDVPTRAHRPSTPTTTSSSPGPELRRRTRWTPGPGELVPEAKLAAVRHVERLDRRLHVVDAQYGGLLSSTASVLVVTSTHTFDVRLSLRAGRWVVTAVHPSRPGRAASHPGTAARHVLRSDRIDLPPAARADVASGRVHDATLEAMLAVSRRWPVAVSVVRSGHPLHVFGTDRLSDHPRGLAFDTWQVDGHAVVRPATPRALVTAFMEALVAAGADNVGGPVPLSGEAFFSDPTHHDHVHAGFPG